jgi:transposase
VSPLCRTLSGHAQSIKYASNPCPAQADTKKKTDHATERDREEIQAQRRLHQEKVSEMDARDCVFLDETGVHMAMARHYARSPQGVRVHTSKPVNKGKNITVLGALSLDGIMASMTVEGSTNAQVFLTYVQTILVPTLHAGQVVFMDNLSSHQVDGVKEAIASVGARLEYLPPYSPDLSPIEKCWSKFKAILRAKAARTRDALDQAITEAFAMITPQDARGWFAHCRCL